jgi:hypothetical protein
MKIQQPKRITTENISGDEAREAVDNISYSQNTFNDEVYVAIAGTLSVPDNLDQTYKVIVLQVDASGIPTTTVQFKSELKSKVQGMTCIRAFTNTVVSQPFCTFVDNSGIVKITHIAGLTADTEYKLVFLLFGS